MPKIISRYNVEDFISNTSQDDAAPTTQFEFVERRGDKTVYDSLARGRRNTAIRIWAEQKELWMNGGRPSVVFNKIRPRFEIAGDKVYLYPFPNQPNKAIEVADKTLVLQVIDDMIKKFKRGHFDEQLLVEEKLPKDPWS